MGTTLDCERPTAERLSDPHTNPSMNTKLKHHEVSAEWVDDEHGPAIMLTQEDGWGNGSQTTIIHPWQLQAIGKHFALWPESCPVEMPSRATLSRRLRRLADHVNDLHSYMTQFSDHRHADLTHELTKLSALADLAEEWTSDLDPQTPPETQTQQTPQQAVMSFQ